MVARNKETQPCGLVNSGNFCYVNSFLQVTYFRWCSVLYNQFCYLYLTFIVCVLSDFLQRSRVSSDNFWLAARPQICPVSFICFVVAVVKKKLKSNFEIGICSVNAKCSRYTLLCDYSILCLSEFVFLSLKIFMASDRLHHGWTLRQWWVRCRKYSSTSRLLPL